MSNPRRLPNGKYQASYSNKKRGIARTRRTFKTRKLAKEWLTAVEEDAHNRLIGHQRRYVFGQALAKYLKEVSPRIKTHQQNIDNARVLRWPFLHDRRWIRLEEAELVDVPTLLAAWEADQRAVLQRSYFRSEIYQLRANGSGIATWYFQPAPSEGDRPQPRCAVTDKELLRELQDRTGRGPFSNATIRQRQILVKQVLKAAWRKWSRPDDVWLKENVSEKIDLVPAPPARQRFANYDQLLAMVIAAPIGFDAAILAGAWIGWRRSNIVGSMNKKVAGLEWDRVLFPVDEEDQKTGERQRLQLGMFWVGDPDDIKNKDPIAQPMSDRVEQLLRMMWDCRVKLPDPKPFLVFHRGDGRAWGDFRRRWETTKRRAGIDPRFRWHDLRHTWASHMVQADVSDAHLQKLGGWKDPKMVRVYGHLRVEHLLGAVNKPGKGR